MNESSLLVTYKLTLTQIFYVHSTWNIDHDWIDINASTLSLADLLKMLLTATIPFDYLET